MRERVLPWLLCFPALYLATPLSPLVLDPYPHLAGTGWTLLLLLPLAAVVIARGASVRGAWPFLVALGWALVSRRFAPVTDTFEARRALLGLAVLPVAFAGGALLEGRGLARFAWTIVVLSSALTAYALARGFAGEGFAGVLGDTGSLSQAALPGAAVAALWLARGSTARRVAGGLALGLFLVHVGAAPVLAGAHSLLAALLLALFLVPGPGRGTIAALALCALIAPFVGLAARGVASGEAPVVEGARTETERSLGGLGVRGRIWSAALGLVGAHPVFGAGPGQFQAAFPPFRDPREIELSRHGLCSELDTEVEHAHNDWLQAFCELGIPGGLAFVLGLVLAARAALRALGDEARAPAAAAALALLVNAFVHAPLTGNPPCAVLAFGLFGALCEPGAAERSRRSGLLLALPALGAALFAPALVGHGLALSHRIRALRAAEALQTGSAAESGAGVDPRAAAAEDLLRARAIAPDSAAVLLSLARTGKELAQWDEVLTVRPDAVEALEQGGTLCARAGRTAEAHARYERALALSPTHPRMLRNAARLELTQGDVELGLALVARLAAQGCLDAQWKEALGRELVLELGAPERGARVLFGKRLEELVPEELHAVHGDDPPGEAGECLAQLLWAREHASRGDFELALRNYRQARDKSHGARAAAAALYVLELAAAELRANRREDARQRLEGLRVDEATWKRLPGWARSSLGELGLGREFLPTPGGNQ